jgi:hypothetical protein
MSLTVTAEYSSMNGRSAFLHLNGKLKSLESAHTSGKVAGHSLSQIFGSSDFSAAQPWSVFQKDATLMVLRPLGTQSWNREFRLFDEDVLVYIRRVGW